MVMSATASAATLTEDAAALIESWIDGIDLPQVLAGDDRFANPAGELPTRTISEALGVVDIQMSATSARGGCDSIASFCQTSDFCSCAAPTNCSGSVCCE